MKRVVFLFCAILLFLSCSKKKIEADILITKGTVYTGLSETPSMLDIAIKDDRIVFLGTVEEVQISTKKTIDASGKIVCPGFIDPHTHADRDLVNENTAHNKPFLFQGVTTVVVGNDGDSFYPTEDYSKLYNSHGIGTNAILLVGHGTVRDEVMGKSDRLPTEDELKKMEELVQQEMDAGVFGISTGLYYAPGSYSNTEEVVALSKIVANNNGIYDTHLRDESSFSVGLINAVKEAISIGRETGVPIHISHIKCLGKDVWGKSEEIIKLVEDARGEGIEVTANQYPYDASATSLKAAVVPRWAESGGLDSLFFRLQDPKLNKKILEETNTNIERRGGPSKLLIVKHPDSSIVGQNLDELALKFKMSSEESVYEILKNGNAKVVSFNMEKSDIHNFMTQQWVVTGSDGNMGHPRKYGSFPRKYAKYVKKDSIIGLATFINNSTYKTAQIFKVPERGAIKKGYYADVIVFDPDQFQDQATYSNAFELSSGLSHSIINGRIAVEEGTFTGMRNGKVLSKE
ncbi:N-acyl-D-amino-acid deacylase family protein [Flagellimonas nanhaiensis]|uniref:Amidohydrolase n=1 Tax=Flagellimonas nanhaiensis TaxID=2292706 RepID=A0A371JLS9_9FLAO|nr:amidohydrolase family protein [Allomuricauda nanhaiensis]RDY58025.1 amidohydrolase [Allomuricauda nanhaiensis]